MTPRTRRLLLLASRELLRGFLRRNERWLGQFSFVGDSAGAGQHHAAGLFAWESDSRGQTAGRHQLQGTRLRSR
jgi:hypothetical protein